MNRNIGPAVVALLLALILLSGVGPAEAQSTSVSKSLITPTGEMRVREGDSFTVRITASSIGSRFWAVLDTLPSGFQIEDASFGASGVLRTAFEFDDRTVVFVGESSNINQTSRVTITYRVLANVGGTYIIFGAIGYIYDTFEGWIPVSRSEPVRPFQVISLTQVELGEAVKRLDDLDARVSRALTENMEAIQKLRTDLNTINTDLSAIKNQLNTDLASIKNQLKGIEAETAQKLLDLRSSIQTLETAQRSTAEALRGEIDNVRAALSQEVQSIGILAIVFAAAAAGGAWLQVVRSRRPAPAG
jgi:uncharacterized protein YoxC